MTLKFNCSKCGKKLEIGKSEIIGDICFECRQKEFDTMEKEIENEN